MPASSSIDVVLQDAPGGIQEGLLARHLGSQRAGASAKARHLYARPTQYPAVQRRGIISITWTIVSLLRATLIPMRESLFQ